MAGVVPSIPNGLGAPQCRSCKSAQNMSHISGGITNVVHSHVRLAGQPVTLYHMHSADEAWLVRGYACSPRPAASRTSASLPRFPCSELHSCCTCSHQPQHSIAVLQPGPRHCRAIGNGTVSQCIPSNVHPRSHTANSAILSVARCCGRISIEAIVC